MAKLVAETERTPSSSEGKPQRYDQKSWTEQQKPSKAVKKREQKMGTNHLLLTHPSRLVASSLMVLSSCVPSHGDFVQADVLDRCPDYRETTGFRRKHINLVGALSYEASETFDGIGGLNVSVHRLRKLVKRQGLLLLFGQASHGFGIAFAIFGW